MKEPHFVLQIIRNVFECIIQCNSTSTCLAAKYDPIQGCQLLRTFFQASSVDGVPALVENIGKQQKYLKKGKGGVPVRLLSGHQGIMAHSQKYTFRGENFTSGDFN